MRRKTDVVESDTNLVGQIKQEVREAAKTENLPDIRKGFVFWVLRNYFDLDGETAATSMTDGQNDKRVDAFIEEEETVRIVQCKFFNDPQKEVGENEIALFKGCLDWLREPEEIKELNFPRLYDAALTFSERWTEDIDVELHFFAFGKFSNGAWRERRVFNNSDSRERVQMYFHDIDDILKTYQSKSQKENPLFNETITLELTPSEYFVRAENMRSVVATIKGKDLLKMYEQYRDNLFERNIRYYRGARKGSINAKIIDTILNDDERQKFWYYNNGISFVCQDFTINENVSPPILEVHGFQVINGCQTTVCLSEAKQSATLWEDIPDEVQVVARFIKAPLDEVDYITLYTNSQNPVSVIQLKSNDPLQKRLKEELAKYSIPCFYSIKEGDWQKLSAEDKREFGDNKIEMSEAAQAIYSFTHDPAFARRWKNKLFAEKYSEIFRKDISVEEIILPWRILKIIDKRIAEYRREKFNKLKKEPESFTDKEKEEVLRREFLIYSNLIILYFIGILIQKRYRQYSPAIAKSLLNGRLEERAGRIFDYIASILEFSEKLKETTNLPRFLKSFDNITTLYTEIEKAIEMEKARTGKDPLKDMLPEIQGG